MNHTTRIPRPFQTTKLALPLVLFITGFFSLSAWTAEVDVEKAITRTDEDGRRSPTQCVMRVSNPGGLYAFQTYSCATLSQKVKVESSKNGKPTALTLTVKVPDKFPEMEETYKALKPAKAPRKIAPFLVPTENIQSDNPEIAELAKGILEAVRMDRRYKNGKARKAQEENNEKPVKLSDKPTQQMVVNAVFRWIRVNIEYSMEYPAEITDAVTAMERRAAHAVGYTHLSAAILRNLGVPTRIVRSFYVTPEAGEPFRFTRYNVVEVYYPEKKQWVLYSPHLKYPVSPLNLYVYAAPDWDQAQHDASKPTSTDPRTRIEILSVQ